MNIIVEGPDNARKSTLIKFLEPHLGRSIIHNTVDKDAESVLAKQAAENALEGNSIYDRSAVISEYIYCMVLQRAPVIDIDIYSVAELVDNSITIFCLPPVAECLKTTKDEMPGVVENLQAIYDAYDKMVDELSCIGKQFFVFDWTIDSQEEVLEYINERIMKEWKK
ncbi:hypothetical protein HBKIJOIA_00069 [Salmonella phage S1]|nr:hypothetical protein HBKIJOIA_00069 [Salmonella phage S1]